MKEDLEKKLQLRLPESLRFSIEAAAKRNNRSMNAEILACLEQGIPDVSRHIFPPETLIVEKRLDESSLQAFVRLMPSLLVALTSEVNALNFLVSARGHQLSLLSVMLKKAVEYGVLEKIPSEDQLRRVNQPKDKLEDVPKELQEKMSPYDMLVMANTFLYMQKEKDAAQCTANLPSLRMDSQISWNAVERILKEAAEERKR